MKRSNSTGAIADLLSEIDRRRCTRRRNSIGPSFKDSYNTDQQHCANLGTVPNVQSNNCSPPLLLWLSPVKQALPPLSSPLARINSPTSRVIQLRKEESVDERLREVEQDREVTTQIQLNQSWNDMKLDDDTDITKPEMMEIIPCPVAMTTGIHFPSPSSPIISSRVRSRSLTPTSPSSGRSFNYYRRSLSPAPLRPSSLVLQPQIIRKRQRSSDQNEDMMDISPVHYHPPAKRAVFQSPLITTPTSCNSPLLATQHDHSNRTSTDTPTIINDDTPTIINNRPAFDTSYYPHVPPAVMSYDHTPSLTYPNDHNYSHAHSLLSGVRKYLPSSHGDHQNMESAFFPFTTAPPTNGTPLVLSDNDSGSCGVLKPVTTIS